MQVCQTYEARTKTSFLTPPLLELDVERTKELSVTFPLVTSNNDTTFKVFDNKRSNTAQATRAKLMARVAVSGKLIALVQ